MTAGRLIIVCGLPGAGKTTLAQTYERQRRAIRLCPDEWMKRLAIDVWDERRREKVEQLQWEFAQNLLRLGQTVVIEWGTWGRSERDGLRTAARRLGAAVELHFVSAPLQVLYERVRKRGREDPPVRLEQIQEWASKFEVPSAEEMALYDDPAAAAP
jgi:predicted kinase